MASCCPRQFPSSLLEEQDLAFYALWNDGGIAGGALFNSASAVTGLSNVFGATPEETGERARRLLNKVLYQELKFIERGGAVFQAPPARLAHMLPCIVEGGGGEILLAGKMTIKSALFQARHRHQLGHGSASVAAPIEDGSRLLDNPLPGGFTPPRFCFPHCPPIAARGYFCDRTVSVYI